MVCDLGVPRESGKLHFTIFFPGSHPHQSPCRPPGGADWGTRYRRAEGAVQEPRSGAAGRQQGWTRLHQGFSKCGPGTSLSNCREAAREASSWPHPRPAALGTWSVPGSVWAQPPLGEPLPAGLRSRRPFCPCAWAQRQGTQSQAVLSPRHPQLGSVPGVRATPGEVEGTVPWTVSGPEPSDAWDHRRLPPCLARAPFWCIFRGTAGWLSGTQRAEQKWTVLVGLHRSASPLLPSPSTSAPSAGSQPKSSP